MKFKQTIRKINGCSYLNFPQYLLDHLGLNDETNKVIIESTNKNNNQHGYIDEDENSLIIKKG